MRARSIIAILLIAIVAVPAVAQEEGPPWEVRPYLSTYTDASFTWNFTATRHRFICSYCGYSMTHTDTTAVASDHVCPNPFGLLGHDDHPLTEATPRQRALSELEIVSANIDGVTGNPLVGRPFHPGGFAEPEWNADPSPWTTEAWNALAPGDPEFRDQTSFMTLRAANLDAGGLISGDGNAGSDALRFMVLKPGAVRPAARLKYFDINEDEFAHDEPQFYRTTVASGTPGATAEDYRIRVNPYRVSDGDVFYIWHYERAALVGDPPAAATTGLAVEVYSTLYGKDFDSDPEATGGMGNLTAENLASYYTENGMRIVTDSGALLIDIPRRFAAAGEGRWVIKVEIQSNTTILPRPEEVNYDQVYGEDRYTGLNELAFPSGDDLTGFTAAGPTWKQSFVWANTAATPVTLATADADTGDTFDVVEKVDNGSGFTSTEIWPYRMPPEAAGRGRTMVQWSEAAADADLTWGGVVVPGTRPIFFNTGREWHYVVDPDSPATRLVTNQQAAAQTTLPDDRRFIDSYFMCSRLQVDHDMLSAHYLGDDTWMNSLGTDRGPAMRDLELATGGQPRLIIGNEQDIDAWGGEYNPGTRTPNRQFTVANRTSVRVSYCPVEDDGCGTRFRHAEHSPGEDCPVCGEAELRTARAEARVHYDGSDSLWSALGARMTTEAMRFGLSGAMVPIGAPDFLQEAFADIPTYQPPSVPAGASTFANHINNDEPYHGTMLAFHRPDYEGHHYDTNTTWDAYYLSPESGEKFPTPEAIGATGAHAEWVCSVCTSPYSRSVVGDRCRFCRNRFTDDASANQPTPFVPYESLVAEEYAPFGVQVSVLREAALAADRRVVDLGWVAPGISAEDAWPSEISHRSELPARNEGNIHLPARMRSTPLLQTGVESAVRSYARVGQSVPITLRTLFRYRQGPVPFGGADWALLRQEATGAAGQPASALIQAGTRGAAGEPYEGVFKPVPLGQPLGNYSTELLLFADTTGDGVLHFHSPIYGYTNTGVHEFNPDIDEPYEPVVSFATRARVVESRLPQSSFLAQDLTPTLLHDSARANLQALWVGQGVGVGGTAPLNILYANAERLSDDDDPLYRGWLWQDPDTAQELTTSATANDRNTSPTAYLDQDGDRWAMWHRSLTTQAGVSSRLQFAQSAGPTWAADPNDYIFGTSGARGGLTGLVREGSDRHWQLWQAGPEGREHLRYRWEWDPTSGVVPSDDRLMVSNTSTGQRGDTFGIEVEVNGEIEQWRYRKPALDPFTYVREPSAWGSTNDDGEFQMDVVFTGHIRSLGNSDICWARFNFGDPADENFPYNTAVDNFGKVAFPRVAGTTYDDTLISSTDARRMPAVRDTTRAVRGYVGEQLQPSPRRESYQARDIDWVVTRAKPVDAETPFAFETTPDWIDWATDADMNLQDYDDPMFYVAVVVRDEEGATRQVLYGVDWSQGTYNSSTGLYTVLPRLVRLATATSDFAELHDPEEAGVAPVWHPYDDSDARAVYWRSIVGDVHAKALLAPSARGQAMAVAAEEGDPWADATFAETWPAVTLTISPASGMVRWSSPLFNTDVPSDRSAVFNSENTDGIVDVVMYADYTPFVRRVTTDSADDDSPSAFWNEGDSGRMSVFWRRSYGDTDAPHFGRPSFMHRTYTRAVQVGRPQIQGVTEVVDLTLDPNATTTNVEFNELSLNNGVLEIEPNPATSTSRIGHRIAVQYQDADGTTRTEHHRVVGWSLETPVPINAVTSEGPVRVTPEVYTVDPAGVEPFQTVRYWLTWSSPRGVFDTGDLADNGQRVRQSSDIYVAVVAPDHSSLIADLEVPRLEP